MNVLATVFQSKLQAVRFLPIFALLAGIIFAPLAIAETSVVPSFQSGVRFDTNPRHRSSFVDFESTWGTIIDAQLPVEYRSQRTSISLNPRLVYSFYPDSEDADLEDRNQYLTGAASRLFRQSNIGASYGYTDLALRTSEFQDVGDSSSGGSGETLVLVEDKQRRWFFKPVWQYQISTKNLVTLNGSYEEVHYDEEFTSRRYDYDYNSVSAAFEHSLNERHALSLSAQFAKFDAENNDAKAENNSETNSLSLIYTYAWSENSRLSADLGWSRTKNKVIRPNNFDPVLGLFCDPAFIAIFPCEFKSDSSNFVGNLTATRETETVVYRVVIGQSITPNSNGAEVLRFNIDANANKQFTERFTGRLGVVAFTQDDVGDSERDFERDYISARVGLRYTFIRNWSIYSNYRITYNKEQRNLFADRTMRNHYFSMGIRYKGDGWRW